MIKRKTEAIAWRNASKFDFTPSEDGDLITSREVDYDLVSGHADGFVFEPLGQGHHGKYGGDNSCEPYAGDNSCEPPHTPVFGGLDPIIVDEPLL